MQKQNHYAEAIDILMSHDLHMSKIVRELAKQHPSILVKLVKGTAEEQLVRELEGIMEYDPSGCYIAAVKRYREKTGCSLREAVDFVAPIRDRLIARRNS